MIGIPTDPLVIEISPQERAALVSAQGGRTTTDDSDEGRLFAALYERGMVKDVSMGSGWTAWKLSGDGLKIAYADQPAT